MIVRDFSGYETSRDYVQLWSLAQKQAVVCVVDYHGGAFGDRSGSLLRDIASTQWCPDTCWMQVGARGIGYVTAYDDPGRSCREMFISECESVNLEWIVPTKGAP